MALKEKLERLRSPDRHADTAARIAEWQGAVAQLFDTILEWLKPYVDRGLMEPRRSRVHAEQDLLFYATERLDIELGGGEVLDLVPFDLEVAGAAGRVDLYRQGHKASGYMLLRQPDPLLQDLAEVREPMAPTTGPGAEWVFWRMADTPIAALQRPIDLRLPLGTMLSAATLERAIDGLLA